MIGFETLPHPFLDLTPEEQITLIKVRDEDVRMHDESLPPLEAMGLVHYGVMGDGTPHGYHLTDGRGTVVAAYLRVLHDVREARRRGQQAHEPKWSHIISDYELQAAELKRRIEELPVNMPGSTIL
jgi:hypothetical protein